MSGQESVATTGTTPKQMLGIVKLTYDTETNPGQTNISSVGTPCCTFSPSSSL